MFVLFFCIGLNGYMMFVVNFWRHSQSSMLVENNCRTRDDVCVVAKTRTRGKKQSRWNARSNDVGCWRA